MPHDFINYDGNRDVYIPRFDSKGRNCMDVNGIMSYKVKDCRNSILTVSQFKMIDIIILLYTCDSEVL